MKENNNKNNLNNQETKIVVEMPDKIEVNLVQANELKHYELFQWLVILLLPIAVGFWTAFFALDKQSNELLWSAIVFSAVSLLLGYLSYDYRKKVFHRSIRKIAKLGSFEDEEKE